MVLRACMRWANVRRDFLMVIFDSDMPSYCTPPKQIAHLSLSSAGLHSRCSILIWPEPWAAWLVWPILSNTVQSLFFHCVLTLLNCSLVYTITETDHADRSRRFFSTVLYPDFVRCCLPKFKENPPKTVASMLAFRAWPPACASVPCRSLFQLCQGWQSSTDCLMSVCPTSAYVNPEQCLKIL